MDRNQWTEATLLFLLLAIEIVNSSTATNIIEGKTPLTQSGSTLASQLTTQGKQVAAYVVGASLLIMLSSYTPKIAYGLTGVIIVGSVLSKTDKNGNNTIITFLDKGLPSILGTKGA